MGDVYKDGVLHFIRGESCLRGKTSAPLKGKEGTRKPGSLLFYQGGIVIRGVEFTEVEGWRDRGEAG
jgi:hypothetical protein